MFLFLIVFLKTKSATPHRRKDDQESCITCTPDQQSRWTMNSSNSTNKVGCKTQLGLFFCFNILDSFFSSDASFQLRILDNHSIGGGEQLKSYAGRHHHDTTLMGTGLGECFWREIDVAIDRAHQRMLLLLLLSPALSGVRRYQQCMTVV